MPAAAITDRGVRAAIGVVSWSMISSNGLQPQNDEYGRRRVDRTVARLATAAIIRTSS